MKPEPSLLALFLQTIKKYFYIEMLDFLRDFMWIFKEISCFFKRLYVDFKF